MKIQVKILAVLVACSLGVATAGEVTGLKTFTSGTKAVASDVNGNFNAIKNAVNDNNSQIAAMQAEHVAYVSPSGGNYADPVAAMADLTTWCGTPSATNPCLLKIMPGVYDLGTTQLQMQSFVVIEGSGENVTHVVGVPEGYQNGVVVGAANSELRDLTVEHAGGTQYATAISVTDTSSGAFSLRAITVRVLGGTVTSTAVDANGGYLSASDTTVSVTGNGNYAIGFNIGTNADLYNIKVTVNGASSNWGVNVYSYGLVYLRHSQVNATEAVLARTYGYLEVEHSKLRGDARSESAGTSTVAMYHTIWTGAVTGAGNHQCVFVTGNGLVARNTSCL